MNPANYLAQNPYGYMPQGQMASQQQQQFHPGSYPNQFQGGMMPQGFPQQQQPGFPQQGFSQSPTPQMQMANQNTSMPGPTNPMMTGAHNNMMVQQNMAGANLAQQAQIQNAAQSGRPVSQPQPAQPLSPQSQQRERARVTLLLDINTALLQEVVSLQARGMGGSQANQTQQSPSSPTSATEGGLNNSPTTEATKGKPPSQEYNDCMRRLQVNLSYLANIADAKKKSSGPLPTGPAIMIPPPHLASVNELYKRLNELFPEASQSTINKAMAFTSSHANKQVQAAG